jgi:outer membrane receptor protein involved in Fe transport
LPGVVLGINGRWVATRLTRDGQTLDSYGVLNLNTTYAPSDKAWSVALGIYNVTGERHDDPVGPEHVQQAVRQDGRELRLQFTRVF